eukprot:jgi/Mesvir1/23393/Mv21088-RA.1
MADIVALAQLLEQGDSEVHNASEANNVTPASIGAPVNVQAANEAARKKIQPKKDTSKDIWDADEVVDAFAAAELSRADDGRPEPQYEFIYRQAVGTEDAYLGMGMKDPSSTSCETLVLKVDLPGAKSLKEIDLDVHKNHVHVSTPSFLLSTYLPHNVDDKRGKAQWDKDKNVLTVMMPIIREFDFTK